MEKRDNYQIQMQQAKRHFLTYDQDMLIEKFHLKADMEYLFVNFLCKPYRINRQNGDIRVYRDGQWVDSNRYALAMTLLDILCDSRMDRHIAGKLRSMESFGHLFHQSMLEEDPRGAKIQDRQPAFQKACVALGAKPVMV